MHCTVSAAARSLLETLFPFAPGFVVTGENGIVRSFASFRSYFEEETESRIIADLHYRWSYVGADALSTQIGRSSRPCCRHRLKHPGNVRRAHGQGLAGGGVFVG